MKIATFNINNINRRLPNLLAWMRAAKPDVVALQELKASDGEFPAAAIEKAGYGAVWRGQKTWNGVAILARNAEPILTRDRLPGRPDDHEARYIEAAVRGVIVTSIYLPNGNPQPGPKFDYKLDWFARLKRHAKTFIKQDLPVVLAGDYNVAPTAIDIYPTRSWDKDALIQPKSRAAFASLAAPGAAHLQLLGLQAEPLAARCGPAARSSPAQPCPRLTPRESRRRQENPRRGWRQRSRAGVGGAAVTAITTNSCRRSGSPARPPDRNRRTGAR
jgi:exodeoxyribonuclease-3